MNFIDKYIMEANLLYLKIIFLLGNNICAKYSLRESFSSIISQKAVKPQQSNLMIHIALISLHQMLDL
jgi:uncharacterized membrane protein